MYGKGQLYKAKVSLYEAKINGRFVKLRLACMYRKEKLGKAEVKTNSSLVKLRLACMY